MFSLFAHVISQRILGTIEKHASVLPYLKLTTVFSTAVSFIPYKTGILINSTLSDSHKNYAAFIITYSPLESIFLTGGNFHFDETPKINKSST